MFFKTKKKSRVSMGDHAPDFTLPNQKGERVRLSDVLKESNVVLYFYPKDNTRYCIIESMTFRDKIDEFKKLVTVVMGISVDTPESHEQFAKEYKLPFPLLSDTEDKVRQLYGVPATFGMIPGRVTLVIDKQGVVRNVFSAPFDPKSHVTQSLETIRSLR